MKDLSIKKLYYSISEVSKITGLEQYVLRYWENEFEELRPSKNRAGNRIYTNKDIQIILYVKRLLRDEKYTIDGAKQILKTYNPADESVNQTQSDVAIIDEIDIEVEKAPKQERNLLADLQKIKELLITIQSKL